MIVQETKKDELATSDKNCTWETTHVHIIKTMARLVRKSEKLPTKTEVAEATGLSRKTVHNHLKEFGQDELLGEELEQFKFMASKVLGKVIERAMDGDMRASRLSLQVMGLLGRPQGKTK